MSRPPPELPFLPKSGVRRSPPTTRDTSVDSKSDHGKQDVANPTLPPDPSLGAIPKTEGGSTNWGDLMDEYGSQESDPVGRKNARIARGVAMRYFHYAVNQCKEVLDVLIQNKNPGGGVTVVRLFRKAERSLADMKERHEGVLRCSTKKEALQEFSYLDEPMDALEMHAMQIDRLNLWEDSQHVGSRGVNLKDAAQEVMLQSMGFNFSPTTHVKTFTGKDARLYKAFKKEWAYVDQQLDSVRRSPYMKLQQLMKVLDGEALGLVQGLAVEDASYELALKTLDERYNNVQLAYNLVYESTIFKGRTATSLKGYSDLSSTLTNSLNSIKAMELEQHWGAVSWIYNASTMLDARLLKDWEKFKDRKRSTSHPMGHTATREDLLEIVNTAIRSWTGGSETYRDLHSRNSKPQKQTVTLPNAFTAVASAPKQNKMICNLCPAVGSHWTTKCTLIAGKEPHIIRKMICGKKLCTICFASTHATKDCKLSWTCRKCNGRHHTMVHVDDNRAEAINTAILRAQRKTGPLLHIVKGFVNNTEVNVLLDSSADVNILRKDIANLAGLSGKKQSLRLQTVGGSTFSEQEGEKVNFTLVSQDKDWSTLVTANTVQKIASSDQPVAFSKSDYEHLANLPISMELPRKDSLEIDLLIGEPLYSKIVTGPIVRGASDNDPVAWGSHMCYF